MPWCHVFLYDQNGAQWNQHIHSTSLAIRIEHGDAENGNEFWSQKIDSHIIDFSIWLFVIEHVHSDCKLVFELIFTVDFDC